MDPAEAFLDMLIRKKLLEPSSSCQSLHRMVWLRADRAKEIAGANQTALDGHDEFESSQMQCVSRGAGLVRITFPYMGYYLLCFLISLGSSATMSCHIQNRANGPLTGRNTPESRQCSRSYYIETLEMERCNRLIG